jgi:hypothetical protein
MRFQYADLDSLTAALQSVRPPPEPQAASGRVPLAVAGTWQVKSSDGVTFYTVRCYSGGMWTCECLGFGYRSYCRHIDTTRRESRG